MNLRYWVLLLVLLCLTFLSGCASRQLYSSSPFKKDISLHLTFARDDVDSKETKRALELDDSESFEDPFADEDGFEELERLDKEDMPDPFESVNRAFFHFNDKMYFWALKPAARGYRFVVPEGVRLGVRNFFRNLAAPIRIANCLLQANVRGASLELTSLGINTFLGFGGIFDPAGKGLGLPKFEEDFGQTLGVWGVGPIFYINWPVIGPSTFRDTVGFFVDTWIYPLTYAPFIIALGVRVYQILNKTSLSIGEYEALREMALDPYIALRAAYYQLRLHRIEERFLQVEEDEPTSAPSHHKYFE
jgi:phospholipid-binding lipoprotein MlaA